MLSKISQTQKDKYFIFSQYMESRLKKTKDMKVEGDLLGKGKRTCAFFLQK
jgi:hypothetical protein